MNFIDEKIKGFGKFIGVISFSPGTDSYNKLREVLLETYQAGVEGVSLTEDETVGDVINDEDYPLTHD
jgi:hypothetical protein